MSSKLKRFLSLLLAITMVLSIVPVSAEGSDGAVVETATSEETLVAQIERTGEKYTSLDAAFKAAQDDDTIKLLDNVDEVVRLSVSDGNSVPSIVLDLNGKTWDCGYGTRINAVNLLVKDGTIGSNRRAEGFDNKVDVFHFGGHAKLPSKMEVENVTFYAELHVNNMAPSDEELGLLATSKSAGRAFNATEVVLQSKQYDVVTVQKAAYLTVNGGLFIGGINAEEGSFVTDNRKSETTDSGETVDITKAKIVTIMAPSEWNYIRTERGVTITFVDPTPVATRDYMQFTLGENSQNFTVQRYLGEDQWEYVEPVSGTSTIQWSFDEFGSETFRVDWDNNGTYDRLVVLVKGDIREVDTKEELKNAIATANDGTVIKLTADIDYGTDHLEITKSIILDLGGHTLTTRARNYGLALKNEGIIVTDGKLNHAGTVAAIKVWSADEISNLEIDVTGTSSSGNTINGIVLQKDASGVRNLKNVKIHSTSGQGVAVGIETYNCGNANTLVIGSMENVTIDAKDKGMLISAPCGTATNCDIKGGVSGIEICLKGNYSAWLQLVNSKVYGGTQAVYAHDEFSSADVTNSGTLKLLADGTTKFTTGESGVLLNTVFAHIDEDAQVILPDLTTVAENTNTKKKYSDLHDALTECAAGEKVILLKDVDLEGVTWAPVGVDKPFEGTFDGDGHTISNLYQSGWDFGYEWGKYGSIGLFSSINNATVKNLTIEGAECLVEGGDVGGITGSATGTCVFENVTIQDSTFATYNNGCGGIIGWSGAGNYTFKDINITSSVTLAGLWGSFDSSIGGIVGQGEPGATYNFENVDIACRIDAYNDCTASYDYYNYRMCGMIIGRLQETTTIDGKNVPDTSKYNISCTNVTVTYYPWANYHYCDPTPGYNGGRGMRVEAGYSYDGLPADYDHSTCTTNCKASIPFDQLFGGAQYGVDGLPTYPGVTVNYAHVAKIGETGYWTLVDAVAAAEDGATITVIADHSIEETVVIDKDVTLDLNGKTVTGVRVLPVIRIQGGANLTVKNGTMTNGDGYCFILGASDGSSAGNLTIESGSYTGETTVASVTKGTLAITGGEFMATGDYGATYLLNCIDANYTAGSAAIVVTGGTFHGFNPEDNTAEGAETNFCALDRLATEEPAGVWTVGEWNYEIYDWDDLMRLDAIVEGGNMLEGVTVKLMNDIDLYERGEDGEPVTFNPIGANKSYFKGTFDGQGHTIKNMYQSGWALGYDWDNYGTIGLFAYLWNATVKDLTIENAECFVEGGNVGCIAGCAWGDCTFENVTIKNSKLATYNNRAGGIVGYTGGEGTFTFKNVVVDEGTVIAGLWGSFDSSLGGIMGQMQSASKVVFEDVRVACRIDGYNDVTASYKWYAYRMCGMLIGRVPVDDNNKPILDNVTFVNDAYVNFGDWARYHYIWDDNLSRGCQRVESGYAYGGIDTTQYPDADISLLPFTSLFGGQQYGSYGQAEHANVIVNYPYEAAIGETKYWLLEDAVRAAKDGDVITLLRAIEPCDPIVVDVDEDDEDAAAKSITLDLNGKTVTGMRVYPVIRIQDGCSLTVKNGTMTNDDYIFVLGASDGSSVGNLTIESGSYTGNTSVASVTKGQLNITGGTFAVNSESSTYLLNCIDANYTAGSAAIVVTGGTFHGFNPEDNTAEGANTNFVAKGYKAETEDDTVWTVAPNMIFEFHLTDANGEAHWLSPMRGNDLNSLIEQSKIWYESLQGTYSFTLKVLENYEVDETVLATFPMTIDLCGNTLTAAETMVSTPVMRILSNVTVQNGTVDGTAGESCYAFIVGNGETAGTLNIVGGTYKGDVSAISVTKGTANISGGYFEATEFEGAHEFTLNCIDSAYNNKTASYNITGGRFYKFNPENNAAEGADTNFLTAKYTAVQDGDCYEVMDYVRWVKAELLAGRDVTLDRDIVVDGTYIESIPAATNGNGRYSNFGIFNVVGDDVKFDLNGHNITYNGHANFTWKNKTYNSCTVAHGLFFANAGANLEVCDSVGNSLVTVNGVASGIYAASPNTVINVNGGSWVNKGCADCDSTNLFLYASHGGKVVISAGNFSQDLDAEGKSYLIVNHNGEYKNSAIDFSKSDITIYGGTFTGMNPEEAHFFQQTADNKLVIGEIYNAVADGYIAREISENVWTVVEGEYVAQITDADGNVIGKYETLAEAVEAVQNGETIVLLADSDVSFEVSGNIGLDVNGNNYTGTVTLTNETATLTAAESLRQQVSTKVENGAVVYEDDVYKVVKREIKLSARTLLFKDIIKIRYYFILDDYVELMNDPAKDSGLLIWTAEEFEAETVHDVTTAPFHQKGLVASKYQGQVEYYGTSNGIAAKNMIDVQFAIAYVKLADGTYVYSEPVEFSPVIYAQLVLAEDSNNSETMKDLAVALMNYGAAAQVHLDYKTDTLMNSWITDNRGMVWNDSYLEYMKDMPDDAAGKYKFEADGTIVANGQSMTYVGALNHNFYAKIDTAISEGAQAMGMLYWKASTCASVSELTAENADGDVPLVYNPNSKYNEYRGVIAGTAAKDLGTYFYTCTYVVDSAGNYHYGELVIDGAHDYALRVMNSSKTSDTMKALAKAMIVYNKAAEDHLRK